MNAEMELMLELHDFWLVSMPLSSFHPSFSTILVEPITLQNFLIYLKVSKKIDCENNTNVLFNPDRPNVFLARSLHVPKRTACLLKLGTFIAQNEEDIKSLKKNLILTEENYVWVLKNINNMIFN